MEYTKPRIIPFWLSRCVMKTAGQAPRQDWRIRRLQEKVREQRGDPAVTLRELASHLGLTASYVGRLLKKDLGIGFRDLSGRARDEYACELLRSSDLSVKEVSAKLGYKQTCDLSHKFKRMHGVTPTSYRQQQKAEQAVMVQLQSASS